MTKDGSQYPVLVMVMNPCNETPYTHEGDPVKRHPVDEALRIAAAHYGVSLADIRSTRRTRVIHAARTWGMYLASRATGASCEDIGKRCGNRDHTIVRAVLRGRAREVAENPHSASIFKALREGLQHATR